MPGVLIFGELGGGSLASITGELVAAGRSIADKLGEEVAVALQGSGLADYSAEAMALGADKVYLVEDPLLADDQVDSQVAAFTLVCRQAQPSVVLIGRTHLGRDLGPRLAFRLDVGLAQDSLSVDVDADTRRVVATRPVYGGSAMARVTFPDSDPQIVIVREKLYEPLEPDAARSGETIVIEPHLDPSVVRAKLVERVYGESEGVRLEDAAVVVGGGRGLGGPEPFQSLEELAGLLNGAVGASRAVCDAGWLPHGYQIGLTGKTISPDLYITIGISGASQHMAGCSSSKVIVAINRDSDANIFKAASYGVVGDWNKVLPSFLETVRELVQS